MSDFMTLKVILPSEIYTEKKKVSRIVAQTREGVLGLLPHRLDCIAALSPGILIFETKTEGEIFVAIDKGILVKVGREVLVSVRRAMGGVDLARLRDAVETDFVVLDQRKESARLAMAKLETGFLRRLDLLHQKDDRAIRVEP